MATVDEIAGGTLGEMNVGLGVAVGFINPLSAQIDAMIALGLGPLQADLAIELSGNLALSASLGLQISIDPLASLRAALAAIAQIQAALSLGLSLPVPSITAGAQLSANAALAAALTAKLGIIKGIIEAALRIKFPAIAAGAELAAALAAGPAIAATFDGLADNTSLSEIGSLVEAKFAGGLSYGAETIDPTDPVSGIMFVTTATAAFDAMAFIATGP